MGVFKTIRVRDTEIIKIGKSWYKEGGDGELYPIVNQKKADEIYNRKERVNSKQKM